LEHAITAGHQNHSLWDSQWNVGTTCLAEIHWLSNGYLEQTISAEAEKDVYKQMTCMHARDTVQARYTVDNQRQPPYCFPPIN
jgi:hypothetical protein